MQSGTAVSKGSSFVPGGTGRRWRTMDSTGRTHPAAPGLLKTNLHPAPADVPALTLHAPDPFTPPTREQRLSGTPGHA